MKSNGQSSEHSPGHSPEGQQEHRTFQGLPPTGGPLHLRRSQHGPAWPSDECVRRLKRYHYTFKRLHEIYVKRLTAEPIYELKMAFSLHGYLCAEHAARPAHARRRDARTAAGPGRNPRPQRWRFSSTRSWRRLPPRSWSQGIYE